MQTMRVLSTLSTNFSSVGARAARRQSTRNLTFTTSPKMTKNELQTFFAKSFPQISSSYCIERVTSQEVIMRLKVEHDHLRPGGTVSGPAMFTLADASMYATILSKVGPKALAVTTNCSIDFLRKPVAGRDLLARCHIHKLGKVLVVGDVLMYSTITDESELSEGRKLEEFVEMDKPVSRATMTYSIPK
jgi:uncharacterized protein (TIGR00369 family)